MKQDSKSIQQLCIKYGMTPRIARIMAMILIIDQDITTLITYIQFCKNKKKK